MAKKRRRRPIPVARERAAGVAAPAGAAEARSTSKEPDFAGEYRYVVGDLKRIAILAAGMFITLGVLALFIR